MPDPPPSPAEGLPPPCEWLPEKTPHSAFHTPHSHPLCAKLSLLDDPFPRPAAMNMALDEALLLTAGGPVLRIYRWSEPAVSFGYFGSLAEVRSLFPTRPLVRRWTGGGIVDHAADWTYSLIFPAGTPAARLPTAESYRLIHGALAAALQDAGIPARLAENPASSAGGPCFQRPVPSDVMLNGQKIAGAAQRRTRHGLLHQGSVQDIPFPGQLGAFLASHVTREAEPFAAISATAWTHAQSLATEKYGAPAWLEKCL